VIITYIKKVLYVFDPIIIVIYHGNSHLNHGIWLKTPYLIWYIGPKNMIFGRG